MNIKLYSVLLLSFILINANASAKVVAGVQRISNTGAVFNLDTSIPALGEAYRDPSGVIWGSAAIREGQIQTMNFWDADKFCKESGTRLPTIWEYDQLARYLGYETSQGYSPYLADGQTDFLSALSHYWFWSSSTNGDETRAYLLTGSSGRTNSEMNLNWNDGSVAVRCVASP